MADTQREFFHKNNTDAEAARIAPRSDASGTALACSGFWTVLHLDAVGEFLAAPAPGPVAVIDLTGVTRMDTAGALVLRRIAGLYFPASEGKDPDLTVFFRTADPHHAGLLREVGVPAGEEEASQRGSPFLGFLNDLGEAIVTEIRQSKALIAFLGHYLIVLFQAMLRPCSLRWTSLTYHMGQVGVAAVPIVALLSFLIGVVVAYMGSEQLALFGAQIFVINLVEVTTLREMGVLMTSIVVAGRSGSSFTAQIGAMVANEEVSAMRSMGLDPMTRLVLPRVLALTLMLPALVFLSDIMGLVGGGVAVSMSMDLSVAAYASRMQDVMRIQDFFVGLAKAPFFAVVIGVVGCYQGFQVTGSAESVGKLTTQSVVEAIFLVIVMDAVFALFFTAVGI